MTTTIDHLVYATPDLRATVEQLRRDHAIDLVPGGPHLGRGTRNYLAGLGGGTYLEVIGPDPEQPTPQAPRPFGVDELTRARLTAWCVLPRRPLAEVVTDVAAAGGDLGPVLPMSRKRPDGVLLEWELTVPPGVDNGGTIPFCIDWLRSTHPTASLTRTTALTSLQLAHPDPSAVEAILTAMGLAVGDWLVVAEGPGSLTASVQTPNGPLTLS
jgi:Glyoxalase-like domain